MEDDDTQLKVVGIAHARRIYDVLQMYRQFDTSSLADAPYEEWLESSFPLSIHLQWGDDERPVFMTIAAIDWINRSATFGIFCKEPGNGYAAGLALLNYAFNKLGLNRLTCTIRADNERALCAIRRHRPAHEEAHFRKSLYRNGDFVDTKMFGILCEDWRAV